MTRPRPPYTPTPRIWTAAQISVRLGHGGNWFNEHRAELGSEGFPAYDNFLGGWDADAIELWLDRRAGIAAADHAMNDLAREIEQWEP